jgi:transposase
MIEVRRRIQRIGGHGARPAFEPEVFRSRYLQLARFDHLDSDQIEALGRVLTDRPELEAAWRMLQHLYGIYVAETDDDANQALGAFIDTYQDHPLVEFGRLTETLLTWDDEIFAFDDCDRVSNGRIEGTNNKLGVLKRVAYGFVNIDNFAARTLLITPGMAT